MKINTYIKKNWDKLPKSNFDDLECVIFHCVQDEDYGYGHHNYEGYGADKNGDVFWCYSSGCSCNGSCDTEHKKDLKLFKVGNLELKDFNYKNIDFNSLEVSFNSY